MSFGAGDNNSISTAGQITGTDGTAVHFTTGTNEASFLAFSETNGDVTGGSGDDRFVLHNNAQITGRISGNGADLGDTLDLAFLRVLPNELAYLETIGTGSGTVVFRGEDYAFDGIEIIDLTNVQLLDFGSIATTPNGSAIADRLDTFPVVSLDLDRVIEAIDTLPTAQDQALRQLSPEAFDIIRLQQIANLQAQFSNAPARSARPDAARALLSFGNDAEAQLWFDSDGGFARLDRPTDAGPSYQISNLDFTFGLDATIGARTALTTYGGYRGFSAATMGDPNATTIEGASLLLGASFYQPIGQNGWAKFDLSYGRDNYNSTRGIVIGGISDTAHGTFDGQHFGAMISAGFDYALSAGGQLRPNIGLAHYHINLNAFEETDAGDLNLAVSDQSLSTTEVQLGLGYTRDFALNNGASIRFALDASLHQVLDDNVQYDGSFANIADTGFTLSDFGSDESYGVLEVETQYQMDDLNGYVFVNLRGERHPAREVNRLSAAFGLHVAFD